MDRWIQLGLVILAGIVSAALSAWQLDRVIRRTFRTFHERAEQQDRTLAVMSAEVRFARSEVARLQAELTLVRFAMESLVEGPPSMRRPPRAES